MKIALAHDSFTQMGGAERVMNNLHELFPGAPVFTLVFDEKYRGKYSGWDIRTSCLQKIYNFHPRFKYLLPFIPAAVGSLNFEGFDVVISSSSGFVKNIKVPKNCTHVNYCHTPARFLWIDKDYINQEAPGLLRPAARLFLSRMRKWDLKGSEGVNYFIANSQEVESRIRAVYQRTSTVIYPPIDVNFWKSTKPQRHREKSRVLAGRRGDPLNVEIASDALAMTNPKGNYFLLAGRLQAHKKNALMVEIFNELGLPLRVVGTGRQEQYLRSIARPNIKFLGKVSDGQLRNEYSGALGFIYPQLEDFGLMPLEAAACGTATLAYGKGGALETVVPGVTGEFFGQPNNPSLLARRDVSSEARNREVESQRNHLISSSSPQGEEGLGYTDESARYKDQIKKLILNWNPQKYKTDALRQQAEKFSKEKFKNEIKSFINQMK